MWLLTGRLESADHLIRKMASCVALAFSKVIDPQNPLYLDDSCREEAIDWDFGLLTPEKRSLDRPTNIDGDKGSSTKVAAKVVLNTISASSTHDNVKSKKKKPFGFESVDPDEIIDAASLNNEDNASETSESSNDSSLQPYDLKDDDADLKRNFSQLVDVIGALRKSDDPDGVSSKFLYPYIRRSVKSVNFVILLRNKQALIPFCCYEMTCTTLCSRTRIGLLTISNTYALRLSLK